MLNGSPISGKGRTAADQPSCFVNAHRDHGDFDDDDNDDETDDYDDDPFHDDDFNVDFDDSTINTCP